MNIYLAALLLCAGYCQGGLLGAGTGDGSCSAAPFRAAAVQWVGGCPQHAACCSEYGYCRGKEEWLVGGFRDCNGQSNGSPLAQDAIAAEQAAAVAGDKRGLALLDGSAGIPAIGSVIGEVAVGTGIGTVVLGGGSAGAGAVGNGAVGGGTVGGGAVGGGAVGGGAVGGGALGGAVGRGTVGGYAVGRGAVGGGAVGGGAVGGGAFSGGAVGGGIVGEYTVGGGPVGRDAVGGSTVGGYAVDVVGVRGHIGSTGFGGYAVGVGSGNGLYYYPAGSVSLQKGIVNQEIHSEGTKGTVSQTGPLIGFAGGNGHGGQLLTYSKHGVHPASTQLLTYGTQGGVQPASTQLLSYGKARLCNSASGYYYC